MLELDKLGFHKTETTTIRFHVHGVHGLKEELCIPDSYEDREVEVGYFESPDPKSGSGKSPNPEKCMDREEFQKWFCDDSHAFGKTLKARLAKGPLP